MCEVAMREYCLLRPLAAAGFFATVLVLTAALGNANRNTDIRPQPESRAGELEECLRELDNDLLGLEGINLHATVDSISQDVSWWPSNSYERQLRNEGQNFECPTLSDVLASAPQLSEIDAALFNACNFFLGSTTNSRFTTVEQSHVPFILVIDPRNVQSSLTTLHSLSGVRGVASTRLYIFVSACGPADASWNLGDTENCKRQSFLQEDSDSLLDFVACETAVSMYLPSDRMMSMHPHRDRGYTTFMVQHQGLPGQEYRKIRDMHALRHVLLIEKNTHTVLLHAGARPLPSFYMYHKASATVAHRSAILVASSGKHKISKEGAQQGAPTSQQASDSPDTPPDTSRKDDELVLTMAHPCLETRFSLSDSLPEGASLGVGRAGLIELFSSLSDSAGLGIVDSLHALHTKWAPNRFFLLPAEIVDIEHPYVQGRENAEHLPDKENHNLANSEVMRNNVWAQSAGDVVKNVGVGLNASTDGEDCVDEVCRDLYDEMARSPEDPLASACAEQGWSARLRPRKVYDCVTYFQEDKMLLLRAKELGAHVDFFIVVEGDRTFQGHVRSLHLPANLRLLEEYAHRIRLIVAELQAFPDISKDPCTQHGICDDGDKYLQALKKQWTDGYRTWFKREWMSRNAIMRGLWDADPDDLILLSDVDEIPRGRTVRLLRHCAGIPTETVFRSRWNLFNTSFNKPFPFNAPNAVLRKTLGSSEAGFSAPWGRGQMYSATSTKSVRCRGFWLQHPWLVGEGWHLSFFGSEEMIARKLHAFSDGLHLGVQEEAEERELIGKLVREGADLHSYASVVRGEAQTVQSLQIVSPPYDVPKYLVDNPRIFAETCAHGQGHLQESKEEQCLSQDAASADESWSFDSDLRYCERKDGCVTLDVSGKDSSGLFGYKNGSITVVRQTGACDGPPRGWPPRSPGCVLPEGFPNYLKGSMLRRPTVVASVSGQDSMVLAKAIEAKKACAEVCVWIYGETGHKCAESGEADLVLFSQAGVDNENAGAYLGAGWPREEAVKRQKQVWGYVGQVDSKFAQLFEIVQTNWHGLNACDLCEEVRRIVDARCASRSGAGSGRAHALIMIPQQGHRYDWNSLDVVVRVSGHSIPEDGSARIDLIGPAEYYVRVITSGNAEIFRHNFTREEDLFDEYRCSFGNLGPGQWEIHMTLLDQTRRPVSADHIFFTVMR